MADVDANTLQELGRIALALRDNPKTRKQFLKAVKETHPNFQLPTDIANEDLTQTVESKFAERDQKAEQDRVNARLASQRQGLIDGSLISGRKFDEETVKTKIEPFMQQKGIADYDDGARLYMAHQPPVEPRPEIPTAGQWTLPKVENPFDSAALANAARSRAFDVIRELNAAKR